MVESAIRNIIYSGCMLTHTYINYTKLYLIISNIYNTLSIISYLQLVCDPHRLGELLNLGQGVGARAEDEDEGLGAGGVSVADITQCGYIRTHDTPCT